MRALYTHLLLLTACWIANPSQAGAAQVSIPPSGPTVSARDRLLEQAQIKPLTAQGHYELAVALLGNGQFSEALIVTRLGSGFTTDAREKSLFHLVGAQSLGALGRYAEAAGCALEGQRLNPTSIELAALRFAYFTKVGNAAQAKSAEDTLKRLKPTGDPVLSGAQIISVILGIIEATKALSEIVGTEYARIEPPVREKLTIIADNLKLLWAAVPSSKPISATGARNR